MSLLNFAGLFIGFKLFVVDNIYRKYPKVGSSECVCGTLIVCWLLPHLPLSSPISSTLSSTGAREVRHCAQTLEVSAH